MKYRFLVWIGCLFLVQLSARESSNRVLDQNEVIVARAVDEVQIEITDEDLVLNEIRHLYHFSENQLITYDGQTFKRIAFKSECHEKLCYKLKDPLQANAIYFAYRDFIAPTLKEEEYIAFEQALLQVCQLLRSNQDWAQYALYKALEDKKFAVDRWLIKNRDAFERFLNAFQLPNQTSQPTSEIPLKIALITTTSSGGNLSVAMAVKAYLDLFPNLFETIFIDYETFANQYDPVKIATGKYTAQNIFRLLQQRNVVDELVLAKELLCEEVAKYIPYRTAQKLKEYLQALSPDLIISTRNYCFDDFNLLDLNIPLRMLYCDHEICFFHQELIGKLDPNLVKFWVPTMSPRFFKPLFDQLGAAPFYQRSDSWLELLTKVSWLTNSSIEDLKSFFEVVGFPVRLEFQRTEDQILLANYKDRWSLMPDERGVIVEIGINGGGILEDIFCQLKEEAAHTFPVKYFFVCGKNEELKEKLEQMLSHTNIEASALQRCEVLGYLTATEKNELMNICELMIAKPGGATQAEVSKLRLPMLIVHIQKMCEEGNREKLFEEGLAYQYDAKRSLVSQIEEAIQHSQFAAPNPQELDWQTLILDKLLELRQAKLKKCKTSKSVKEG